MQDNLDDLIAKIKEQVEDINEVFNMYKSRLQRMIEFIKPAFEMTIQERFRKLDVIRGDIWLCNFGVNIGSEMDKTRPAIVVQSTDINKKLPTTIVIPITSKKAFFDTEFNILPEYLVENVFEYDVIGCATVVQTRNVSVARLHKKIGTLNEKGIKALDETILRVMDIRN